MRSGCAGVRVILKLLDGEGPPRGLTRLLGRHLEAVGGSCGATSWLDPVPAAPPEGFVAPAEPPEPVPARNQPHPQGGWLWPFGCPSMRHLLARSGLLPLDTYVCLPGLDTAQEPRIGI